MPKPRGRRSQRPARWPGHWPGKRFMWPLLAVAAIGLAGVGFLVLRPDPGGEGSAGSVAPWATLGTADVHSLAFDPADSQHLYFGHHGGLLESRDGGRSWSSTTLRDVDAMNVKPAGDGRIQIAGHDVYVESSDGGQSWQPVPNDLPGLDLHAFAVDPVDPSQAWAFAVGFGLFSSTDAGRHWEPRQQGNWPSLSAFRDDDAPILVAISEAGLQRSDDQGSTWRPLPAPPGQLIAVTAAVDGSTLYIATADGVYRSADEGSTWTATAFEGAALTLTVAPDDSNLLAVVDEATRLFRSSDSGSSFPGSP